MGSRSHDFEDELKISFWISSSVARSKTFILDLISGFCTDGILCTLSGNFERIVSILSAEYLEKWSQSDFTDVNYMVELYVECYLLSSIDDGDCPIDAGPTLKHYYTQANVF